MRALALFIVFNIANNVCFGQYSFNHTTDISSINGNTTLLLRDLSIYDDPELIYMVDVPDGYLSNIGVWHDGLKWRIFHQDMSPMKPGTNFQINVYHPVPQVFVHTANESNTRNGVTYTNHPYTLDAEFNHFKITQNFNPGGKGGIYNDNAVELFYDKEAKTWAVRNRNGNPIPLGASFNILYTHTSLRERPVKPNFVVPAAVQQDPNLGFENGLTSWTATGNAFSNQPVTGNTVITERVLHQMQYDRGGIGGDYWKGMAYHVGHKGNNWVGTYESGNGDAPSGTLTSISFPATKRYLTFLMGGGKDINRLFVELQVKQSDYDRAWGRSTRAFFGMTQDSFAIVARETSAFQSEELFRYYFDLQSILNNQHLNASVRVRIVDEKSDGWGHINVDDFLFADSLSEFLSIQKSGFSLLADKDKPIWGFADLHAHWVNHVGLKGLMHGSPGGNWQLSDVRSDVPPCDEFSHRMPTFLSPGILIASQEKEAMKRLGERVANFGNLVCTGLLLSNVAVIPAVVGEAIHRIAGPGFYLPGESTADLINKFHAVNEESPGFMLSLMVDILLKNISLNPVNHVCAQPMISDILTKHYGNNTPPDRPEVSNYVDFPRWSSFMHQTMHISQVRRSYEGGQRLMVVPVGVAKSWEFVTLRPGEQPASAKRLIEQVVAELKRLVSLNSDWMGIAYTPEQARKLVLENKMTVVIAIEQAEIGNYFTSVKQEIDWLESLGIRHYYPIHNINNKLGGCAVFNSNLNAYNDLVHRTSQDGPVQAFRVREGRASDGSHVEMKMEKFFMRQKFKDIPIAGFGEMPFIEFADVPSSLNYEVPYSHKNAEGLTAKGKEYILELMKRGIVVDVDHMSDRSQDSAMLMLNAYNYPMVAGHANFRHLRRNRDETKGDAEPRLKTEFTIHDDRLSEISQSGGMVGIMNQQNNIRSSVACPVPNNAAGGSPSFAQAYWYVLQKTGGQQGIAFGSDFNGFAPQIAPRFGVQAAYFLEGDELLNVPCDSRTYNSAEKRDEDKLRRCHAFEQRNGVRYDVPIKTYHYHRFPKPEFLTSEEREIWEAIAIAKSGVRPEDAWQPGGGLDPQRTGLQQDKIKNMAVGFQTNRTGDYLRILNCPEYVSSIGNDCMAERKAAFMCRFGPSSIPVEMQDYRTQELYMIMRPIYDLWMQFENGPNEPLRRFFAYPGGRDYDFNLDGHAHYGLYPDLIQDLKNLGLNSGHLRPLFLGAEQYIKVWEQSVKSGKNIIDRSNVPIPSFQRNLR